MKPPTILHDWPEHEAAFTAARGGPALERVRGGCVTHSVPIQSKAKKTIYPAQTRGSQLAAKARRMANTLGDKERERLYNEGMSIIYGDLSKRLKV